MKKSKQKSKEKVGKVNGEQVKRMLLVVWKILLQVGLKY